MYEVWWIEGEKDRLRAKFRGLGDAIRYVWRYGHERDARVRLPDGRWKQASAFDKPPGQLTPRGLQQALGSWREQAGPRDQPGGWRVPPAIAVRKEVTEEVTRRLGTEHSRIVERAVNVTLDVLLERWAEEDRSEGDSSPRRLRVADGARPDGGSPSVGWPPQSPAGPR